MKGLALIILVAACTETHTPSQVEITNRDCSVCHSTTLIHPEDSFPIASMNTKHGGIDCADCHVFSSGSNSGLDGVHANCVICHPRSDIDPTHIGRQNYVWDSVNHDFCVGCHPMGFQ
jgi:hypothetical protein